MHYIFKYIKFIYIITHLTCSNFFVEIDGTDIVNQDSKEPKNSASAESSGLSAVQPSQDGETAV